MNTTPTTEASPAIVLTNLDHKRLSALATGPNGPLTVARRTLAQELDYAHITEPAKIPPNVVTMNTRVTVREETSGTTRTYTLVYPNDEDISVGNLSVLTPVGAALIGNAEGEVVTWVTRDGHTKELTVLKILYQPEADGRFDL